MWTLNRTYCFYCFCIPRCAFNCPRIYHRKLILSLFCVICLKCSTNRPKKKKKNNHQNIHNISLDIHSNHIFFLIHGTVRRWQNKIKRKYQQWIPTEKNTIQNEWHKPNEYKTTRSTLWWISTKAAERMISPW